MSLKKPLQILMGLSVCLVIILLLQTHTGNRINMNTQHTPKSTKTIKNVDSIKLVQNTSGDANVSVTGISFSNINIKNINFNNRIINSTVTIIREDNINVSHVDEKPMLEFQGLPVIPEIWQYPIEPKDFCKEYISLIIYVHSYAGNTERRQIVRNTWGDNTKFRENDVVFIVGMLDNVTIQDKLLAEAHKHGDILQVKVREGFYNLTYKTISALHWIDSNCQLKEKYILKTDDDMFINMFTLAELIRPLPKKHVLMCKTWPHSAVKRQLGHKYEVSHEEYKFEFYPAFCSGSAYLMTQDVLHSLHLASLSRNPFKLDDVYVTGFLREHVDISLRDKSKIYLLDNFFPNFGNSKELIQQFISTNTNSYVFFHLHNLTEYEPLWKKILMRNSELNNHT